MVVEQLHRDRLERRRHRRDLRQHVAAVTLVLAHPLDPPHLPLDPVKALDERGLVVVISGNGHVLTLLKRLSRRLLPMTKRLEQAIAAAATIGVASPATARGSA